MSLATIMTEERRLAILKVLSKAPGNSGNIYVLHRSAEALGHVATLDQVRGDLAWLDEQGLILSEDMDNGMVVAVATQRGLDAAMGRARIPGVAIPAPKA